MQDTTFSALLSRALHHATGSPEATASIGRIIADPDARERLRAQLDESCEACDHNRAELRRAVAEVARLRQALQARESAPRPAPRPSASSNGNGNGGRRRPRPIIELDAPAQCYDCGAELDEGDTARVYPGGRVYGTDCHGRR